MSKKAKAVEVDTSLIGATVIYTPSKKEAASLKATRGLEQTEFAAIVTGVSTDGATLNVLLPTGDRLNISAVTEGDGEHTWRHRA